MPAVILGRGKTPLITIPIRVIAGEEEPILKEKDAVALRVARRRDS